MTNPVPVGPSPSSVSWKERIRQFVRTVSRGNFIAGLATSLVLGGIYFGMSGGGSAQTSVSTSVTVVTRQSIVTSIQAAGKVTFSSEQQMKFNQKGTVTKVNVKLGAKVKQGEILAEIDNTSVLADIRSAQLAVSASSLQLQQLLTDSKKTISDVQNTLTVSEQKLPSSITAAKQAVEEKQAALDQASLDLEKQKRTELQSLASTAQSTLSTGNKLLDSYYSILTRGTSARPHQGNNTDLIIDNYMYNDPTAASQTEFAYLDAVNAADAMLQKYGTTLGTETNPTIVLSALNDALTLADNVSVLGQRTYDMLQGAATDPHTFTPADLTADRATVASNQSSADSLVSDVQTAQTNLVAISSGSSGIPSVTLQQKEDAVTTAEHSLQQAKDNLRVLETQSSGDLVSQQQAVTNTSTDTNVSIQLKQNDIAQKQATLQKIRTTLVDYRLVAPFDGVITHIDYKVGDNLLDTGDTEFLTVENPGTIIVTIPLDQVDVVHVKTGMTASIAFDAIPGQKFQGTLYQIDSTAITTSGVVSYNVSVELPTPPDLTILSGMTATVNIETSRKDNVLVVPNLAIQTSRGQKTVQRANGETVTVQTGVTDGSVTEITSGLSEGDGILSINLPKISGTSSSANANAAQQLLRGAGGFGGGGGRPGG